jgi:sec-independent protein translocase protein TatB
MLLLPTTPMFSVPHLILIFIVALIVFGPEKLPELARNLGKVMADFRRVTGDLRSTLDDQLRELEREANERKISGGTPARGAAAPLPPASTVSATKPAETAAESAAASPSGDAGEPPATTEAVKSAEPGASPDSAEAGDSRASSDVAEAASATATPMIAPGTVATNSPYLTRSGEAGVAAATSVEANESPKESPHEELSEKFQPEPHTASDDRKHPA